MFRVFYHKNCIKIWNEKKINFESSLIFMKSNCFCLFQRAYASQAGFS